MRGFTLVEMILVLAICSVAFASFVGIYINYNSLVNRQRKDSDVVYSAGRAVDKMHDAILQSDSVVASHAFGGTTQTSATSSIVLELPSINAAGDTVPGSFDYLAFYTTSTSLYQIVDAASSSARIDGMTRLNTVLQSLSFTYDVSPPQTTKVDIDMQTQASEKNMVTRAHVHEQAYLRN